MELVSVIYSHSSYFDVLDICLKQFPGDTLVAADKPVEGIETLIYDESLTYSERLIQVLEQISQEWVLYTHEDHILYDDVDWELIYSLSRPKADFIKLCRTGRLKAQIHSPRLFQLDNRSPDIFAVQPTIWRRESFISFLKKAGPNSIQGLEIKGPEFIGDLRGWLYWTSKEKERGRMCYDSLIYPCILTAICNGKWNMGEYGPELAEIFAKYGVDSSIRGII